MYDDQRLFCFFLFVSAIAVIVTLWTLEQARYRPKRKRPPGIRRDDAPADRPDARPGSDGHTQASTVLVADSLLGPYEIVRTGLRPLGMDAGDFDLVADPARGEAGAHSIRAIADSAP